MIIISCQLQKVVEVKKSCALQTLLSSTRTMSDMQEIHNWNPLEKEGYVLAFAHLNSEVEPVPTRTQSGWQTDSTGRAGA